MRLIILSALLLASCAITSPIQLASSSKSAFDGAVYKGETVSTGTAAPGNESYRVFIQGSTGFVPIQAVRDDAEQRAKEYCGRKGKAMESLSETVAKPPYILGNWPRVEIVFDCVTVITQPSSSSIDDPKFSKLVNLKKLLDSGVITQAEFEQEKGKILAQP